MTTHRFTRRRALQSAGVALLGAALAGQHAAASAAEEPTAALDVGRAAALGAVLAALAQGPATDLDVAAYTTDFDAFYADSPAPFRRYADETLDAIAAEAPFMTMAPEDGYALLRTWATEPPRQGTVAAALDLASLAFDEDELKTPGFSLVTGGTA
jgi:hypothetical protein